MKRTSLINLLFGQSTLPTTQPTAYSESSPPVSLAGAATVDRLETTTSVGVNKAYLYVPTSPLSDVIVVAQGHETSLGASGLSELAAAFLAAGYPVVLVGMPGLCGNGGNSDHNTYTSLEPFLLPTIAVVNYLTSLGYTVNMTGLSGGGWTTHVAAAIDERIRISIPVAGSLPWDYRSAGSIGDWEQAKVLEVCDYPAMYAYGCSDGRTQIQVLNRNDPACFARAGNQGAYGTYYGSQVAGMIDAMVDGSFRFVEDITNTTHSISAWQRSNVFGPLFGLPVPFDTVIDDGDSGFTTTGTGWQYLAGQGNANDVWYCAAGTGTNKATWNITLPAAGTYRVSVSFSAYNNRATNAPYTVKQGGTTLGTYSISQWVASGNPTVWATLGNVSASAGTLTVELTDNANNFVIADAVRVEKI